MDAGIGACAERFSEGHGPDAGRAATGVGKARPSWQIDATKIYTSLDGWVWRANVLDLYDRRVVGRVVRKTCRAEDAKDVQVKDLVRSLLERMAGCGRFLLGTADDADANVQ